MKVLMELHDALIKTVYNSGMSLKEISGELDYSPSELSRRCNHQDSITFPLDKLPKLMETTKNYLILETLAEQSGYELKIKEKSPTQLIEELKESISELPVKLQEALKSIEGRE